MSGVNIVCSGARENLSIKAMVMSSRGRAAQRSLPEHVIRRLYGFTRTSSLFEQGAHMLFELMRLRVLESNSRNILQASHNCCCAHNERRGVVVQCNERNRIGDCDVFDLFKLCVTDLKRFTIKRLGFDHAFQKICDAGQTSDGECNANFNGSAEQSRSFALLTHPPPCFRCCQPDRTNQCTDCSNRADPYPPLGRRHSLPWRHIFKVPSEQKYANKRKQANSSYQKGVRPFLDFLVHENLKPKNFQIVSRQQC